jgi:hypothetical protein
MQTSKEVILSQFEPDIASKLLEFGHRLSNLKSDYFLFMSRKFCCLHDVLTAIGVPPVQKPVISEKVLDLNLSHLKHKSIQIADDIIICGSTIWKTVDRLKNAALVSEAKVNVFCVNEKWWVPECVDPDYKSVVLSDSRAMTFCSGVVNVLSIAPRPYAVEYPLFLDVELKSKDWHRALSAKEWNPFDITTGLQRSNNISSYTFFPASVTVDDLRESFGENIFQMLDIIKVRLYVEDLGWGLRMTILPIVTFMPMNSDNLEKLFQNHLRTIAGQLSDRGWAEAIGESFQSNTSKLRLLQFNAATLVCSRFMQTLRQSQERELRMSPRHLDLSILFGPWNIDHITQAMNLYANQPKAIFSTDDGLRSSTVDLEQTELASLLNGAQSTHTQIESSPRNIISDFNDIFLALYNKKEIDARTTVREAAKQMDWERIRKMDRLETGITWTGILEYLKKTYSYELTYEVKNTLSLVLDSAIDKGITVPVVRFNPESNLTYRAYRHGEDVLFAEEETELCGLTVEQVQLLSAKPSISKLVLEKILVLLIKIGAANKFLQVQYGPNGQDGLANIGFYLHGAIAKYYPSLDSEKKEGIWLSDHLVKRKVIERVDQHHYRFGQHVEAIQIQPKARIEAKKLGRTLGKLIKGKQDATGKTLRIDEADLILLSTCWCLRDVAEALRIELVLFKRELFPLVSEYVNSAHIHSSEEPLKKLENLFASFGHKALNSLHLKYVGWLEDRQYQAVEKGKLILQQLEDESAALDWEGYWSAQDIVKREDEEKIFSSLVGRMADVGHRLLFYVNLLEIQILLHSHRSTPTATPQKRVLQSVDKLKDFVERIDRCRASLLTSEERNGFSRIIELEAKAFVGYDETKLLSYISDHLSKYHEELIRVVELTQIQLLVFEHRGDSIEYKHAFYYDIMDSTATKRVAAGKEVQEYRLRIRKTKEAINAFIHRMEADASKEDEQVYCWNGDSHSTNDAKYVFFTGSKPGFSLRRLSAFIDRLFSFSSDELHFRGLALSCDAFYSHAFRLFHKAEVDGEQFWEHLSRVLKKYSQLEADYNNGQNLLLVVGQELADDLRKKHPTIAINVWEGPIETEVSGLSIKSRAELWRF